MYDGETNLLRGHTRKGSRLLYSEEFQTLVKFFNIRTLGLKTEEKLYDEIEKAEQRESLALSKKQQYVFSADRGDYDISDHNWENFYQTKLLG